MMSLTTIILLVAITVGSVLGANAFKGTSKDSGIGSSSSRGPGKHLSLLSGVLTLWPRRYSQRLAGAIKIRRGARSSLGDRPEHLRVLHEPRPRVRHYFR